jgi:translation initiation factor 3 subunit C
MPHDSWVSCNQELSALISLLLSERDYVVQEVVEEYDDMVDREPEVKNGKTEKVKIAGGLIGLVENLDNEVSCYHGVYIGAHVV